MFLERFNMDLGNSLTGSIIDGNKEILEMPTAMVKISKEKANDYHPDKIAAHDLKNNLIVEHEGEYFLIGKSAEVLLGNDNHIGSDIHEKATSNVPYMMFLASVAVYQTENNDTAEDIYIDYFSTMLPINELLQADKFSNILNKMADRFKGKHIFKIVTNGCERQITIHVKESKCYAEGLTAKYALQYNFDLTPNPSAQHFLNYETINVDLGGGTIDLVKLTQGLGKPKSRNDFDSITEAPYLGMIKKLRNEKLRKYFDSARELETFIVDNYKNGYYQWINGKTGEKVDLTSTIASALKEYTETVMPEILNRFTRPKNSFYKINYFGGVAPILRDYIREYLNENFSQEVATNYHHIEPDHTARFLNLYGLEIISRQNTLVSN